MMTIDANFLDRSARVVLVDSSGAVRQLLSEVAKSVGFLNAQAVASIADAHTILETEGADWLIVPLASDQPVTGMQTARLVSSFAELRNVRVSLLLDENEIWCLPKAFEFGLLSYHIKPFTKDSLKKDLDELIKFYESHKGDSTLVSSEYLRKVLKLNNSTSDLLQLEKTLLEMYPGAPTQLLNLAHAQQLSGQTDQAKITLKQASYIDSDLAPVIDAKAQELFGSKDLTVTGEAGAAAGNALGLNTVVIIDSDDATRAATKVIFEELGVGSVKEFADGESAWEAIDSGEEPNFIVMEWRLPKLTGPLLMQRIRSKGFLKCPVVVQSSLVKASDMAIVREMGVSNIVQKPADRSSFLKTIIWTIQQDRMPTETQTLETKIRAMLSLKNVAEAESLATRFYSDDNISAGKKNVVRSEISFAKEQYPAARDFAIEALKGSGESIFALNVLGKSLMYLRQFDAALKCFKKAQAMSPVNLERIVMIAENQAEMGEAEAAVETIATAKDIDPESPTVQQGEVRVAITSGSPESAKKMLGKIEGVGNVISYLNNKAVAHAKCGLNEEGIQLYRKTLDAVPDDKIDMRGVVIYNMALAKIRENDLTGALADLDEILKMPKVKVAKKASSLKQRLDASMAKNVPFALRESDAQNEASFAAPASPVHDESSVADESSITSAAVMTSPGDLCCYLVFKSSGEETEPLTKILATPPRFKLRKAIERGETFVGADANSANKAS